MVPPELTLLPDMRIAGPVPPRLREALGRDGLSAIGVVDTSPLSLAASAGKAAGFLRTLEQVRELVNITQDMSLLDPFKFPVAIPEIARINNVPEAWMDDADGMAQKAKGRA